MFGAATGSIAGLATITPASGFVSPMSALVIGLAAGAVCYISLNMKSKLGYDDSLDAFGVHGVGGILGTLATGLFAQSRHQSGGQQRFIIRQPSDVHLTGDRYIGHRSLFIYSECSIIKDS